MDVGRQPRKRNKDKDRNLATWNVRIYTDLRKLGVKLWKRKALEREE
jgi:hypothetical protein